MADDKLGVYILLSRASTDLQIIGPFAMLVDARSWIDAMRPIGHVHMAYGTPSPDGQTVQLARLTSLRTLGGINRPE